MSERKLVQNPPVHPGRRNRPEVRFKRPEGGPPVCIMCGTPMPGMRNVCPECGYATPWFKFRFWVGGFSVLMAALGIGLMVLIVTGRLVPPPLPEAPAAVEEQEEMPAETE